MQNTIYSLGQLFKLNSFRIPQYQRAYAWDESHLEVFLEDLRQQVNTQKKHPGKQYFLGTLLLHEESGVSGPTVNIVDGQQRMTTSVVLIATALKLLDNGQITLGDQKATMLRRSFVFEDEGLGQKFHTIQEDEPFFRSQILGISSSPCSHDSPSSERLLLAGKYFKTHIEPTEWSDLVRVLNNASVMVYAVDDPQAATQIFELQNDRGKRLTDLEALKSFLMHCVYLHSQVKADAQLAAIQTQFAKIFRTVERLGDLARTPAEDQLLAAHCAAFLAWTAADYNDPKKLVKNTIKGLDGEGVIAWIENFVGSLVRSYQSIEVLFRDRDKLQEFAELLLLNRMGSFWPLLLKSWRLDEHADKRNFRKVCRLLEVFAFRGYAVSNLRADTSLSSLFTDARDFVGDFGVLHNRLREMSHWHNVGKRFADGLNNPYFFQSEGGDGLYLLWRYENYLRSQRGQTQPPLPWRDFVEPVSYKAKFSIEHIAPQSGEGVNTPVEWNEGDPQPFHAVALHRLGNLVIDSTSPNSAKGAKDFAGKLQHLAKKSIYLSQGELVGFLEDENVAIWDLEAIKRRHIHLVAFALEAWNPDSWYND